MALVRQKERVILTEEQRLMYSSEKLMNFRWISKIMATYSPYTLSSADFASMEVQEYLADIGQFAEVAYSTIPTQFIFDNLGTLMEPGFPLEGYDAFRNTTLVSSFVGKVAQLPGYVAFRHETKQLVVAFCGTTSAMQAFYDVRALQHRHPSHRGNVHSGFWKLYKGIKAFALSGIRKGLDEHDVSELVITGHSMGATVSQLLLLDILRDPDLISTGSLPLRLVVFGAPRVGTKDLRDYWQMLLNKHREQHGESSLSEYSVKTYNDGVPSLPPRAFGYRHFAQTPLYFVHGRLYHVPPASREYALFHVTPDLEGDAAPPEHPRGGHNYYNGRDMEKFARRIGWLDKAMKTEGEWKELYRVRAAKHHSHR
ncbi:Alpha/Beta hydrolase protein [Mycena rebaudengoi]|nr:Alpha/Beta hydrolase protein [Mycena rebaudengoi]